MNLQVHSHGLSEIAWALCFCLVVLTAVALGLYALQLRNTAPISITPVQTELRDIKGIHNRCCGATRVFTQPVPGSVWATWWHAPGGLTAAADPVAINLARRTTGRDAHSRSCKR